MVALPARAPSLWNPSVAALRAFRARAEGDSVALDSFLVWAETLENPATVASAEAKASRNSLVVALPDGVRASVE